MRVEMNRFVVETNRTDCKPSLKDDATPDERARYHHAWEPVTGLSVFTSLEEARGCLKGIALWRTGGYRIRPYNDTMEKDGLVQNFEDLGKKVEDALTAINTDLELTVDSVSDINPDSGVFTAKVSIKGSVVTRR